MEAATMDTRPTSNPGDGPSPAHLMQLGLGFWGSRAFLSAVELGVFSELAGQPLSEAQLRERIGLHARASRDFFDSLVALGVLRRDDGKYSNTDAASAFLDRAKPGYIGGVFEMAALRLYPFWGALTEALRTGLPQNEAKHGGDPFSVIYSDPHRLRNFLGAMTGISMGTARAIATKFPWNRYQTFVDVGGAQGCVPVQIALAHQNVMGAVFDLPQVEPVYKDYVRSFGLEARLQFHAGDFFRDPLPAADVLIMGHILHDWDLEQKLALLKKAHATLPKGGALIVYDAMIDNDRTTNTVGLLMSLNMLIESPGGFDYTPADCQGWLKAAGFRESSVIPLDPVDSMVIAIK
jgi:hypothetical protein